MSVEKRKTAVRRLGSGLTLKEFAEMEKDWDIQDVNEFLHTKGTRLDTWHHRLKRESDVRVVFLHLIWKATRQNDTGIAMGYIDYGMYLREKRRRERNRRKGISEDFWV